MRAKNLSFRYINDSKKKKNLSIYIDFSFRPSSLAQCPYFHNYFHNFLAIYFVRHVMERNVGRKRDPFAGGRASSTFPLKRPLNHNLFGPSFHCISLKMIYALFVVRELSCRLWVFSRGNRSAKPKYAKFS